MRGRGRKQFRSFEKKVARRWGYGEGGERDRDRGKRERGEERWEWEWGGKRFIHEQ